MVIFHVTNEMSDHLERASKLPLQRYITLQCLPLITLADTLTQLTQLSPEFLVHPLLTLDLCKAAERCLEELDGFWTKAKLFEW